MKKWTDEDNLNHNSEEGSLKKEVSQISQKIADFLHKNKKQKYSQLFL